MQYSYRDNCVVFDDDFVGYSDKCFNVPNKYKQYIDSIIVPNGMIKDRLEKMSVDILETFESNGATSINLLCVLKGGFKFASDLGEKIQSCAVTRGRNISIFMDFIVASTYENDVVGHETQFYPCSNFTSFQDKDVLIVEDLVDTGTTLNKLIAFIKSFKPRSVFVACLLVKRRNDCPGFEPDCNYCWSFNIPSTILPETSKQSIIHSYHVI
ncbi:Hypoxanthine-guanine phosphoribosyltransferase isoform 1 [Schistosoma japonicum]|uniref:Hypoxanthine-guanine phosphoribosyltransferase isoform 1 n=1 Tax=Schistosoma japonicum TaxID=6182 RepID=A0A4Z2DFR8_SCHJA|nr:Hypoxanthine-guanine phosphoribosyltransferase isoform 1 [Schistosoma japonicum]TNN15100.1 Hypoxanthine-guanine phosphoribosyltransferase isoform 1 [Schistosoma japonicum]